MIDWRRRPHVARCIGFLLALALLCRSAIGADAPSFETFVESVRTCRIDTRLYRSYLERADAILLNLPSSGALSGILVTQFYFAPGRNGKHDDYGVVFNAPLPHVASALPQIAAQVILGTHERELVSLARETGNPRNNSQALLICRGGVDI
jgi:hypothetical protein